MNLLYTLNDVREYFDSGTVKRGTDYHLKDKVLNVAQNESGDSVYGAVDGSRGELYTVHIRIVSDSVASSKESKKFGRDGNSLPQFRASCSCYVQYNCKHAVALLMTNWYRQSHLIGQALLEESKSIQDSVTSSDEIDSWARAFEKELSADPIDTANDIASNTPNRLLYVFNIYSTISSETITVDYLSARKLKSGGFGKDNQYDPARIMNQSRSSFISTDDEKILRDVYVREIMDGIDYGNLSDAGGGEILLKMLDTGRCYWKNKNSHVLSRGASVKGSMCWQTYEDGSQQLKFTTEDAVAVVLPTIPPLYFNDSTNECGLLEIDVPPKALKLIQQAPRVSADNISVVAKRLTKVVANIPKPASVKVINKTGIAPVPCLHFCEFEDKSIDNPYDYIDPEPVIEITMNYKGKTTSLFEKGVTLSYLQNNQLVKLKRDLPAEKKHMDLINQVPLLQFQDAAGDSFLPQDLFVIPMANYSSEQNYWMKFILEDLPKFREQGWQITYDDDFPYRVSEIDEWHMDVDDDDNNPWFNLDLGIVVEGERYNLIHIISILIKQNPRMFKNMQAKDAKPPENILMKLNSGSMLAIPYERVARIVNVLVELYEKKGGVESRITLPKWRAGELNELQSQGLQWQGGEALKKSADKLSKFKGIKAKAAPGKFKAKLRDYQKEGLAWLQFLREYDFHGVLADDMGLGKTVQTLAHISVEKTANRLTKPVLVIAPTSLMYNWRHEAEQFAPDLSLLTLHGPNRKKDFGRIADHDIVLTTYPLLGRDDEVLLAQDWHMLILDEAQNIKNPKAKSTKIACQLKAKHRLCLTGTPMENHLGELWSMFHFLMPGLLGDEKEFRQLFRNPIEKHGDNDRAQRLAKRIAPFMLRRKKDEVAKELPEKTEIVRSVVLEGVQRDLYEAVRISMQKRVRDSIGKLGIGRSHIIVLDALLKLRQICCDPRLLKTNEQAKKANSAKLDLLMSLLPELLEEGRRILLFSQFTSMLGLIEDELKVRKIKYVKLTGSTRKREAPIDAFQKGEVPLFLISLKAGGTGLNLTTADTVIHYDPWWNPAAEAQATDRAHRIGQKNPVFVYKLLTEDTVEARIQVMQATKRKLAEGLFDNVGKGKLPDAKSLEALFEPL